ncbi:uncharacterized protein [Aristolochia californica]|uniref:uncharacterized protein isoform X2 n=1 Tax=Aristolochia californica TaxID=171875 RepID=UPI0035D575EF
MQWQVPAPPAAAAEYLTRRSARESAASGKSNAANSSLSPLQSLTTYPLLLSSLRQVREPRATHNCWAYKIGDQYRCNDDGEPSGTAGKPIYSAIASSGIDRVMVVVIRYFGGIKLGTGGLVRAYGGVTTECLRDAPTCLVKSKVLVGLEVPFDLLGSVYHQLQSFQVEDIKQDYDTGEHGTTRITFRVDYDRLENLENTIKTACSRRITFSMQTV